MEDYITSSHIIHITQVPVTLDMLSPKKGAVALDDKKHHGDSLFFVKNGGDWEMFLESLKFRVL